MSIRKFYNTTVSTKRLSDVDGSKKETFQTLLTGLQCHIQPISGESQLVGVVGGYYQTFRMFCASSTDIQEGDKVISGSTIYLVRGVLSRDFGKQSSNKHLEVLISLAK